MLWPRSTWRKCTQNHSTAKETKRKVKSTKVYHFSVILASVCIMYMMNQGLKPLIQLRMNIFSIVKISMYS